MPRTRSHAAAAALLVCATLVCKHAAADDDLSAFRDRFRAGLARLEAGQTAEAIVTWEAVYAELGPTRGYRLAYNLGIAYDRFGDASRAAERFLAFLSEVAARRERGETLDASLQKQADDATERMAEISRSKGRVSVRSPLRLPVQIDGGDARVSPFTAFLPPGAHVITFEPGSPRARRVEIAVREGQAYEVDAPSEPAVAPAPVAPVTVARMPPQPGPQGPERMERPFPWPVLAGAAGLTAASVLIPVLTYGNAGDLRAQYDASKDPAQQDRLAQDYEGARSTAYATVAIPVTLAAATVGLTLWYVFGAKSTTLSSAYGSPAMRGQF